MSNPNHILFIQFYEFLKKASATFNEKEELLLFPEQFEEEFRQQFPDLTDYKRSRGNIKLGKDKVGFPLFWSDQTFKERVNASDFSKDIGVLNIREETPRFFDAAEQTSFFKKEKAEKNFFFQNARTYFQLLDFLEKKNDHVKGEYEFVDFFNRGLNKIVFTSSEGQGRVILSFPRSVPSFDESVDYSLALQELREGFNENNKNLPVFIKNELISHLKRFPDEQKVHYLFTELGTIIDNAKVNFNVYLHELSIEKIKREYKEYKDKYFDQINSILGKLTGQVIALPLTILGAAYAIEKANVSIEVQIIILIAITLTTVLLVFFMHLYKSELEFIKQTFEKEYTTIRSSNFFLDHEEELKDFELIENHIRHRIRFVQNFIWGYYWIMTLFNLVLIGFILFNLKIPPLLILGVVGVLFLALMIVFWLVMLKN